HVSRCLVSYRFSKPDHCGVFFLSLHDALPIYPQDKGTQSRQRQVRTGDVVDLATRTIFAFTGTQQQDTSQGGSRTCQVHDTGTRSEEHTSELQSRENLVCRLLLEKKKQVQ